MLGHFNLSVNVAGETSPVLGVFHHSQEGEPTVSKIWSSRGEVKRCRISELYFEILFISFLYPSRGKGVSDFSFRP